MLGYIYGRFLIEDAMGYNLKLSHYKSSSLSREDHPDIMLDFDGAPLIKEARLAYSDFIAQQEEAKLIPTQSFIALVQRSTFLPS